MSEDLDTWTVVVAEFFCLIPLFLIFYSLSSISDPGLKVLGVFSGLLLFLSIVLMVFEVKESSW